MSPLDQTSESATSHAARIEHVPGVPVGTVRGSMPSDQEDACPLCGTSDPLYLFISHGTPVRRCSGCGLTQLLPPRSASVAQRNGAVPEAASEYHAVSDPRTEQEADRHYGLLLAEHGVRGDAVLVISATGHPIRDVLEHQGYTVASCLNIHQFEDAVLPVDSYDCAVVIFQLEKARDPVEQLRRIRSALRPDGLLIVITPSLDSLPAKLLHERWTEWRPDNLFYFSRETLQGALLRAGFDRVRVHPDHRRYTLSHIHERASSLPRTALTRLITFGGSRVPAPLRSTLRLSLPTSGIVTTARRVQRPPQPVLSIVMPVFNERASFERTIERVIAKDLPGITKEIIIVESNSTDGTRELVERYRTHPGITVILQDRPRGKGNAVREGLARASGDVVLIQDADEEYDVQDYDALITPVLRYQRAFVLGSRHTGDWKLRKFNDAPGVANVFNIGHILFLFLLNVIYGQRLRDPFTMYKVFWRDCIHDVAFVCDRFDFDFELVIKLLRKGYRPLEIPVNYDARSFSDGKKVSLVRDPITWLRALARFRFGSIYIDGKR
jgi:SAM-dependent methyltransferase